MGGCVSTAPKCRTGCGVDSAENCFGYCQTCYQKAKQDNQHSATAVAKPKPVVAPAAAYVHPPVAAHPVPAEKPAPSPIMEPGRSAVPPPAAAAAPVSPPYSPPPAEAPAFSPGAEGNPGGEGQPAPSPPPAYNSSVPGGPTVMNSPPPAQNQYAIPPQQQHVPVQQSPAAYHTPVAQQPPPQVAYQSAPVAYHPPPATYNAAPVAVIAPPIVAQPSPAAHSPLVYIPPDFSNIQASGFQSGSHPAPVMQINSPVAHHRHHQANHSQPLPVANVKCPHCSTPLYLPPSQAAAKCPTCHRNFQLAHPPSHAPNQHHVQHHGSGYNSGGYPGAFSSPVQQIQPGGHFQMGRSY